MTKAIFISVNNNDALYDECVRRNPFVRDNGDISIFPLDNRTDNQHISKRYNQFLETDAAKSDAWLVFCHNDWEMREDIIPKLDALDTGKIYGPIGAKYIPRENKMIFCGTIREMSRDGKRSRTLWNRHSQTGTPVDTLDAQCLIVHSSLVKKHKMRFDEKFDFHLYVEDFSVAANENHGIKTEIAALDCIHHNIIEKLSPEQALQIEKNMDIFRFKYPKPSHPYGCVIQLLGADGDKSAKCILPTVKDNRGTIYKRDLSEIIGARNDAMAFAYDYITPGSRVLDIGCACGDLGKLLHDTKKCKVVGLDYNQESVDIAKATGCFEQCERADMDNFKAADLAHLGKFDFIVMGDVLEHLRDPMATLAKLRESLEPGGAFALSIPNIAHASVKAALLCDRFDYKDVGLLDRTHIHFFTWNSIARELADANLLVEKTRNTIFPKGMMLDFNPFRELSAQTRRKILRDPHSHVGQYVVLCRNHKGFDIEAKNRKALELPRPPMFAWMRVRRKPGRTIYRLFGFFPVMLVRHKPGLDIYRLFGFIPLIKRSK
ncbi:MAG: class I SAM-dependent methyltransferase [Rickettsiales bacterium]|jgi:2-polyprenyl-3-methyl-5-hydroxy-6-metoxy-1,4-benzoquinol methylase|nr:class I SAM-dependent methyltransferase [Rickettsiales bacterium]